MSKIIQRISQFRLPASSSWAEPFKIVLLLPFMPHRSFDRVREGGYLWLGLLVYTISSLLGLRLIQTQEGGRIFWVAVFHPVQELTAEVILEIASLFQLAQEHYFLIFVVDFVIVVILAIVPTIAARALFQQSIPTREVVDSKLADRWD